MTFTASTTPLSKLPFLPDDFRIRPSRRTAFRCHDKNSLFQETLNI